jgi:hypothetical protein
MMVFGLYSKFMMRLVILVTLAAPFVYGQLSIMQGPVVDATTYSSARVTWITDQPSDTVIRYGRSTFDAETTTPTPTTHHSWYLSGLAPGTTYRFQVCSTDKGKSRICSDERTVTTEAATDMPSLPRPPEKYVDTSMPQGGYGDPFVINESCSNLPEVLKQLETLQGDLNYEILLAPRTTCAGLWVFPVRRNHSGWIVMKSTGTLPGQGERVGPEDYK